MAKVTKQKARKNWRCEKCGAVIKKGDEYYALRVNYHPVRRRCLKCRFKSWELSSSYYVRTVGQIREDLGLLDATVETDGDYILTADELTYIEDTLAELADQLEQGIEGMPENLMDSAPVQERQAQLDILNDILDNFPDAEDDITPGQLIELLDDL